MANLLSPKTGFAGLWGPNAIITANGTPLANTTPTITTTPDGSTSGGSPTFYTDWTRTTTTSAPVTDGNGNLTFWTDPGLYLMTYTLPGASPTTFLITVNPFYPDSAWNVPAADTSNVSAPAGDHRMVNATGGAVTETIPAPGAHPGAGQRFRVTKTDSVTAHPVWVTAADSSIILSPDLGGGYTQSKTQVAIYAEGQTMEFISDGTNWHIVSPRKTGIIELHGGATSQVPSGAFFCNNQSLATALYPDLFSVCGYTWGGSGANFLLPDFRSVSPMGSSGSGGSGPGTTPRSTGSFYGTETHTIAANELPVHTHSNPGLEFVVGVGNETNSINSAASSSFGVTYANNTGNSTAPTTQTPIVHPVLGVSFIIWA